MIINKIYQLILSSTRVLITVLVCGLFLVSTISPAQAVSSKVTDGEVTLEQIQSKTDRVSNSDPRGIKEISKEAQKGLNGVQGSADKDKMISPEDAKDVTTIKEQATSLFKKLAD